MWQLPGKATLRLCQEWWLSPHSSPATGLLPRNLLGKALPSCHSELVSTPRPRTALAAWAQVSDQGGGHTKQRGRRPAAVGGRTLYLLTREADGLSSADLTQVRAA